MEQQIAKGVRLPKRIIAGIERLVKPQGSTVSQFLRTAAIEKYNREKAQ